LLRARRWHGRHPGREKSRAGKPVPPQAIGVGIEIGIEKTLDQPPRLPQDQILKNARKGS